MTDSVASASDGVIPSGLLLLADARFPVGGHVHSAGLEAAVSIGDVGDERSLDGYLRARLRTTGRVDAAFAAASVRACRRHGDVTALLHDELRRLDAEYAARTMSPYLREVSRRLGRQLLRAVTAAWPCPAAELLPHPHQPLALGVATVAAGGDETAAAVIALHHVAGAVTSAATRLLGLDPIRLAALQAHATAQIAGDVVADRGWDVDDPADLPAWGGCLTEILGEHHGSRDARLFAS